MNRILAADVMLGALEALDAMMGTIDRSWYERAAASV
jgi:hypothetical protein